MAQLCINLCSETLHSQFGNSIFTDVFDSVRSVWSDALWKTCLN
jgi:hypothetical protein